MSAARTSDCRKFSPNIFNKSKCSHCFRQREEHSAAALECNRASRKVSKCGYLFVAPDWDFSNPLYRTKRWQRRWFVLYDDGELTYSVDEHPETVPQACIDMTKVLEVTTAEDVTGHTNSIAITAPDRVTFVKGTCPEESKWWLNILAAFPKSKGRHKRNATFPGGQATTILQTNSDASATATTRNRHNSYHKDALMSAQSAGVLIGSSSVDKSAKAAWQHGSADDDDDDDDEDEDDVEDEEDDGVETGEEDDDDDDDVENKDSVQHDAKVSTSQGGQDENNRNAGNEITNKVSPTCLLIEDIRRDEKTIKDIANTITNLSQQQKNRWSTTVVNNVLNSHHLHSRDEIDFHRPTMTAQHQQQPQQTTIVNLRPKSLPLASNSTPAIVSAIVKKIPPVLVSSLNNATVPPGAAVGDSNNNNNNNKSHNKSSSNSKSSPRLQMQLKHLQQKHQSNQLQLQRQQKHIQQQHQQQQQQQQQQSHERGDPDGGCNLDDLSSNYLAKTSELRVVNNAPAEESLNSKKGWLMKQDNRTGDWTKHWFTLSGAALFYYRDPVSEERGVLDGVLDVNGLTNVAEVNANKSYAFQLTTWDKRRLILASLSPNSRNSWIAVLRNAAGLQPQNVATISNASSASNKTNSSNNNSNSSNNNNNNVETKLVAPASNSELIIKDNINDAVKSEIEKDFIKAQRNHELLLHNNNNNSNSNSNSNSNTTDTSPQVIITTASASMPKMQQQQQQTSNNLMSPITPPTPKTVTHFSSDEEYRTASEGGRRDSVDWGSPLSPSPPIPPSLSILRAKDRMCLRTTTTTTTNCPRLHKRSRSSPPSSRRSTVDSVGSDELPPSFSAIQQLQQQQQQHHHHQQDDRELQFRLTMAEKERNILRDEAKEREARMTELLTTLERTERELTTRIHEMEVVRENLTAQLEDAKRNAGEIVDRLSDELEVSQKKIKDLEDRLARGIDENETLYKRLRELESCSPSSFNNFNRNKMKRMDSLSDLTQISDIDPYCMERDALADEYNELRSRFEKAVNEIRAMKRELKESQNQFDSLEISYASLKQDYERKEIVDHSQLQMMAARIQDLTLKYSSSERQVRSLKQKLAKSERRRSLSLKGKEQVSVSKELEMKVNELETKADEMEKVTIEFKSPSASSIYPLDNNLKQTKKSSRRRSLESSACADSIQFLMRVNELEKRFEGINGSVSTSSSPTSLASPPTSNTPTIDGSARSSMVGTVKISEHLIERLRCLENVLIASKDRLEQGLQQLHNLRSSRTRRSVSPITDRKDSYRYVERCLSEVVKLIRESCETCIVNGSSSCNIPQAVNGVALLPDSSPVKMALTQLEAQLRNKLTDLLKQRRVLRDRNELTKRKDLELLAERVAYESVCFGRLRDSVARVENAEQFGERQTRAEVAETSHLMTMLKAKLSGKCALKPSGGSLDILAGVLARRLLLSTYRKEPIEGKSLPVNRTALEPVDQNIFDDLLRQQNEINVIAKRYKNNAMENLATGLAAETLSYISSSSNDLVQGAVQEAWRLAQETVNAELVQSEIAHIMLRSAERFDSTIAPAFGFTLTAEERLSFEKFADAVHDTLRKEMEVAITQLTNCYGKAVQHIKHGQWRMHMEQDRKISEGRQLLSEFADIVAHKALIDARITVLRGDYVGGSSTATAASGCKSSDGHSSGQVPYEKLGITALQKYENLFEELSNDLQIDNAGDILAEADFEFVYKQQTINFVNDRQVLADISSFLSQLEDSLIALQCEAVSSTTVSRSAISIESLQDVCHKCCELRQRADQLLEDVHRKLSASCTHCLQMRDKMCQVQQQHDSDMLRLQQTHAKDMSALMQQVENQRNALKNLEASKNAINSDLHRSEELIDERERELAIVNDKLQSKEDDLRSKESDQLQLLQRLDEHESKLNACRKESETLTMKLARQDEEYVVLLQERDFLQAELVKERERSRRLEKRLELLELEHGKQLECLQEAYRDQLLSHCSDFTNVAADEESFRQRYQDEIEQLRTLCEKGLSAMESSHRRIISNLEEKHRQEIERLLNEKETALAEETQATLAALDAMRKAHQSEVQREVARFKQEFLKQFQNGDHDVDTNTEKEEELEDLRQEILSFSEKYSIKCVENAALEEKLRSATQKLKHFQQMQQLELRNKQFRAHLAAEDPTTDANYVQGLRPSKGEEATCQDSEV